MTIIIFSDASFDPATQYGVAGYLAVDNIPDEIPTDTSDSIALKTYEKTTNTRLELQAALFALSSVVEGLSDQAHIIHYSDCQTLVDLHTRREKLEKNNFCSGRTGLELSNADLYRKIYKFGDEYSIDYRKLKGHVKKESRNKIDDIFALVDQEVRLHMRKSR